MNLDLIKLSTMSAGKPDVREATGTPIALFSDGLVEFEDCFVSSHSWYVMNLVKEAMQNDPNAVVHVYPTRFTDDMWKMNDVIFHLHSIAETLSDDEASDGYRQLLEFMHYVRVFHYVAEVVKE